MDINLPGSSRGSSLLPDQMNNAQRGLASEHLSGDRTTLGRLLRLEAVLLQTLSPAERDALLQHYRPGYLPWTPYCPRSPNLPAVDDARVFAVGRGESGVDGPLVTGLDFVTAGRIARGLNAIEERYWNSAFGQGPSDGEAERVGDR